MNQNENGTNGEAADAFTGSVGIVVPDLAIDPRRDLRFDGVDDIVRSRESRRPASPRDDRVLDAARGGPEFPKCADDRSTQPRRGWREPGDPIRDDLQWAVLRRHRKRHGDRRCRIYATHTFTSNLTAGRSYHVALTWDSVANKVKGYLNGELVFEAANTTWPTNFGNLTFGAGWEPDRAFKGELDNVRIWNIARSQADIVRDMDRQLIGTESGLVASYLFDEASGSVVVDQTGTWPQRHARRRQPGPRSQSLRRDVRHSGGGRIRVADLVDVFSSERRRRRILPGRGPTRFTSRPTTRWMSLDIELASLLGPAHSTGNRSFVQPYRQRHTAAAGRTHGRTVFRPDQVRRRQQRGGNGRSQQPAQHGDHRKPAARPESSSQLVTGPNQVVPGQQVNLSWTVSNTGNLDGQWSVDRSAVPFQGRNTAGLTPLAEVARTGTLTPENSYTAHRDRYRAGGVSMETTVGSWSRTPAEPYSKDRTRRTTRKLPRSYPGYPPRSKDGDHRCPERS